MAAASVVPDQGAEIAPAAQAATETKPFWGPPTAKVGTGALAGALATLLVAMLKSHATWINDAAVVTAITSLLTFAVQYLVPERT